jgi:signal transduction histidine kinase
MIQDDLSAEDLLAIVAHDLKSPISAVRGYIELIQHAGELNPQQEHYCGRALAGLERMEHLIFGLLDMFRLESELTLEWADCDLGEITQNVIELIEEVAQRRGVEVHVQVGRKVPLVRGDRHLLGQVMLNLLTNAVKYNREGGQVFVRVSSQPDLVRVDVQDTGLGIPEEDQEQVFARFYRASNSAQARVSGSGLGLAIVKTIIEKHDGYIWLKSTLGEGSIFSFTLPCKEQLSDGTDTPRESASDPGEGRDVYVRSHHEPSIEADDAVDDNTQEAPGSSEIDSTSDVL